MLLLPLSPKTAISRLPAVGAVVNVAVMLLKPFVPSPTTALYLWTSAMAAQTDVGVGVMVAVAVGVKVDVGV